MANGSTVSLENDSRYCHSLQGQRLKPRIQFGNTVFLRRPGRLAAIDDEISIGALGPEREGKAQSFEDQYLSTGGQLYELIMGHDRFQADLRPLLRSILKARGLQIGIVCHPYDL